MNFLYVRVSTEEQGSKGWSLDGQEKELREFCTDKSCQLYTDCGTGSNTRRPGLQQMLAALPIEHPAAVVVWRPDRLSRSQSDFWRLLTRIERVCPLHCLNPPLQSNDPHGRMMFGILSSISEYEIAVLKQRTALGLSQARASGHHCGSPGYGFRVEQSCLLLDPDEQRTLKKILAGVAAGLSYRSIARSLNDEKIPTKKGGLKWYASTIRSILLTSKEILQLGRDLKS